MPILDINTTYSTASFAIYSNGDTLTEYTFADDEFTLAPLTAVVLPLAEVSLILDDLDVWMTLLIGRLDPERGTIGAYDVRYDHTPTDLRFRFFKPNPMTDATGTYATGLIDIKARNETTLTVREMQRWLACWRHFTQLMGSRG